MSGTGERVVLLDGPVTLGKEVLGGKAWSIVQMRQLGLPVPPAFALPVPECRRYHESGKTLQEQTWSAVLAGLRWLEERSGRRFGDPEQPLLVSVRSGAPVSMPGMMDTVLNLGINDQVERALARLSGDPDFARDTHARFCHQFGRIVLGADIDAPPPGTPAQQVRTLVRQDCGCDVPEDPFEQLRLAICAVFDSWHSRRAVAYRRHWGISQAGGTAVTVQAMVFGNLGQGSGTGVLFTRNPLQGTPAPYGEWLPGGQGEDVVSGTHAVQSLADLAATLPEVHAELLRAGGALERLHGDVQDIEFTVERGRLHLLQTRAAKRAPEAAVRTAVDLVDEGVIDPQMALTRVAPEQVAALLRPRLAAGAAANAPVLGRGEPACPGVAVGVVVTDSHAVESLAAAGEEVVLVRPTTSPEDVSGMIGACAVVTEMGGSTSHAAVVTRALGRPCVVGVGTGVTRGWEGQRVTVDASTGVVYAGALRLEAVRAEDDPALSRLLAWARESSPVRVVDPGPDTSPGAGVETVVDADRLFSVVGPASAPPVEQLAAAMRGASAVHGAVLATLPGAQAVLRAGVPVIVADPGQPHLLLLLLLLAAARQPASS